MIKREHTQKACSQPAGSDNFLGHATQFVAHCLKCDLTKIKRFMSLFFLLVDSRAGADAKHTQLPKSSVFCCTRQESDTSFG